GRSARRRQGRGRQRRPRRTLTIAVAVIAVVAVAAGVVVYKRSTKSPGPLPVHLPTAAGSYLGVNMKGVPASYAGVTSFTSATGASPDLVMYYSGWYVPFPVKFADTAASNGAVPLVQMDPDNINPATIPEIASGKYDGYLSAYAEAVRAYHHPVIISFGHEMNGTWYKWAYGKLPPADFVADWRHIVTLFRTLGADNVTWLWTANIINDTKGGSIPDPAPWWPGSAYVNWVGLDGYYLKPNWQFAPLFGPTITAVRGFTDDPILIAETGATTAAGQPGKISDLFDGIQSYGLLGFVYYDNTNTRGQAFGLDGPAAIAAFRKGASTYHRPT
ncbi:MAG: glycoside hydrolase family 26 protein, partial [Streptosporangiaceae bacterium]